MLALGGVLAAAALAAVQAHQLARPLERLAARAARIGDGDFSPTPFPRTHIPEIDRIGPALEASSQRVDTMLANERHFTADATHQLRTGITGIAMRFEILSMRPEPDVVTEAQAGLQQTDQLNATIDELLAAARNRSTQEREPFDLAALVNDHAAEWQPRFSAARRHLSVITAAPAPVVFGTKGLAGQVIDILIDNALKHGDGAVTLMIDGPSVVVIDQGKGMPPEKLKSVSTGPSTRPPSTAVGWRSPAGWRRSTAPRSTSSATSRCGSASGSCAPTTTRLTPHGEPARKTSRRLQEAGILGTASGRKRQQYRRQPSAIGQLGANFLQNRRP